MDTRIWALLAVVLFIGGFAGYTGYFSKVDAAHHELAEAKEQLENLQEELADDGASGDASQSGPAKLNQLAVNYETLEAHKKSLADAVLTLEGKRDATLKAYRDAVENIRSKSIGTAWADVPFRNGQVLRGVRIQKITQDEVTLAHSEGVARMRAEELPVDLRERFRIGMEPFVNAPASAVASGVSSAPAAVSRGPGATASPVSSKTSTLQSSATGGSLIYLEDEVAASKKKISDTESSLYQWRNRAISLRNEAAIAKASGRPTYNYLKEAAEADQQAASVDQQLTAMRTGLSQLRQKLSSAKLEAARSRK